MGSIFLTNEDIFLVRIFSAFTFVNSFYHRLPPRIM